MKRLKLQRLTDTGDATFGMLVDGEANEIAITLEPPWRDNRENESCIPPGEYVARRRWSNKHGCELFGIEGVPDRSNIEIHIGNYPRDTDGCVLVGRRSSVIDDERCIVGSVDAFKAFMRAMRSIDECPFIVLPPADQTHTTGDV